MLYSTNMPKIKTNPTIGTNNSNINSSLHSSINSYIKPSIYSGSHHTLLLLSGGESNEREISLISGGNVAKALTELGYKFIQADPANPNHSINNSNNSSTNSSTHSIDTDSGKASNNNISDSIEKIILANPQITGVVNMLHGGWGEGGGAQALCEKYNLPHNSSNSLSCQIFQNKDEGILYARKYGLRTPEYHILTVDQYAQTDISYPHIVKPISEGSTLNVMKILNDDEKKAYYTQWKQEECEVDANSTKNHTMLDNSTSQQNLTDMHSTDSTQLHSSLNHILDSSAEHKHTYTQKSPKPRLVEEFIDGLEYSIAFYNSNTTENNTCKLACNNACSSSVGSGQVFGGINIEFNATICDYETKYSTNSSLIHTYEKDEYAKSYQEIKEKGLKLYNGLNCSGFVRMDFIIQKGTGIPFFLEGNTIPGMTYRSVLPDIAKMLHGMDYKQFVNFIVQNLHRT